MSLSKIKNPVEYSFTQWMNNHPESAHWADKERFLCFVRTVCRYRAAKWKNTYCLQNKILARYPHFNQDYLERLLALFAELIQFYKIQPLSSQFQYTDRKIRKGYYIEMRAKNGALLEKEVLLEAT